MAPMITSRPAHGILAALLLGLIGCGDDIELRYERVQVQRGNLNEQLEEIGVLTPRDPELIKTTFRAKVQWIVEDGSWVNEDDLLFILNEEEELSRVAEDRTELLSERQEIRLSRLRRQHAELMEAHRLATALRKYKFEQIRYRILTSKPVGGDELIRLHEELSPLEQETNRLRLEFEGAQDQFQQVENDYLEKLEAWQLHRDELLRMQARIDEITPLVEQELTENNQVERQDNEEKARELEELRARLEQLRQQTGTIRAELDQARAERDAAAKPRDALAETIAKREQREEELYIRIEIEKRGLPLTRLRLDEESKLLELAERTRAVERGRIALAAGALSQAELDELIADLKATENNLAILRKRIVIAEQPLTPEEQAEADAQLAQAKAEAESAQDKHDRALAMLDQDIAVRSARINELEQEIEQRSRNFPSIIESNIAFARRELDLLEADDKQRRAELEQAIAEWQAQLEQARLNPPNVERAPVAGIVRLKRKGWGRQVIVAGEDVRDGDTLVEIYPSANMDVVVPVNEVDVRRIERGMPATMTVPALADLHFTGTITHVSGIGRDKLADRGGHAGVVEFSARIKPSESNDRFRQGMSTLTTITIDSAEDVLYLPRAAVSIEGDQWQVMLEDQSVISIEARPFGPNTIIIESGLTEGQTVLIPRIVDDGL